MNDGFKNKKKKSLDKINYFWMGNHKGHHTQYQDSDSSCLKILMLRKGKVVFGSIKFAQTTSINMPHDWTGKQ